LATVRTGEIAITDKDTGATAAIMIFLSMFLPPFFVSEKFSSKRPYHLGISQEIPFSNFHV
jgi:hypothetical protein